MSAATALRRRCEQRSLNHLTVEIHIFTEAMRGTYAPGDKTDLKPGAKVFIGAATKEADGTLSAARINVGRDAAPPM
jgi:hypothetical protein